MEIFIKLIGDFLPFRNIHQPLKNTIIGSFNFVYCLAGKGKRFTEKNIRLPKYLLKLDDDQTILEKSIQEFNFPADVYLYLVINKEHQDYVGRIWKESFPNSGNKYEIISHGRYPGAG